MEDWRTCERVVSCFYWSVCKKIFKRFGFRISSRKIYRHVSERFNTFFQGSKGYTPGNTLINNVHKVIYEDILKIQIEKGFGYGCRGAEHVDERFGLTLDLSDFIKKAGIFTLINALIDRGIKKSDLYTILGRHELDVWVMKSKGYRKIKEIVKKNYQKKIYYKGGQKKLGLAFENFILSLIRDLKYGRKLRASFIYVPDKSDYHYIQSILKEYSIEI